MDTVFLTGAAVVAVGFLILMLLPKIELRTQSGRAAAAAELADDARAAEVAAGTTSVAPSPADDKLVPVGAGGSPEQDTVAPPAEAAPRAARGRHAAPGGPRTSPPTAERPGRHAARKRATGG
jgi:hypothetical protein